MKHYILHSYGGQDFGLDPDEDEEMFWSYEFNLPECLDQFLDYFVRLVIDMEVADTWDEEAGRLECSCDFDTPVSSVELWRRVWDYLVRNRREWPLPEMSEERLAKRTVKWQQWRRKWLESQESAKMDPDLEFELDRVLQEDENPPTYARRLYDGVEYHPYTGELVWVPVGSADTKDGWVVPDVPEHVWEDVYAEDGTLLVEGTAEWEEHMSRKYFNW